MYSTPHNISLKSIFLKLFIFQITVLMAIHKLSSVPSSSRTCKLHNWNLWRIVQKLVVEVLGIDSEILFERWDLFPRCPDYAECRKLDLRKLLSKYRGFRWRLRSRKKGYPSMPITPNTPSQNNNLYRSRVVGKWNIMTLAIHAYSLPSLIHINRFLFYCYSRFRRDISCNDNQIHNPFSNSPVSIPLAIPD